jgi:hypothetical protein
VGGCSDNFGGGTSVLGMMTLVAIRLRNDELFNAFQPPAISFDILKWATHNSLHWPRLRRQARGPAAHPSTEARRVIPVSAI